MISEKHVKEYCFEDISLIENYEAAIADKTQTWVCHHRWETDRGLSPEELIFCCEYEYVPADKLIFLTKSEHNKLHKCGNKNMLGKNHSDETKRKIGEAMRGKPTSDETRRKMGEAKRGMLWWNNGVVSKQSLECPGPEWKRGRLQNKKKQEEAR